MNEEKNVHFTRLEIWQAGVAACLYDMQVRVYTRYIQYLYLQSVLRWPRRAAFSLSLVHVSTRVCKSIYIHTRNEIVVLCRKAEQNTRAAVCTYSYVS